MCTWTHTHTYACIYVTCWHTKHEVGTQWRGSYFIQSEVLQSLVSRSEDFAMYSDCEEGLPLEGSQWTWNDLTYVLQKSFWLCRQKTEGGWDEGGRPVRMFSLESMLDMTVIVAKHRQHTPQMYFICSPDPACWQTEHDLRPREGSRRIPKFMAWVTGKRGVTIYGDLRETLGGTR